MIVGLGTGSTARYAIERLGERLAAGELADVAGVPTSFQSSVLAREHRVPLIGLDQIDRLDLAIDGADEVDPRLDLIKGGGGAHTLEKIVAANADRFIVVIDESKLVDKLGAAFPVPVEVLPMAVAVVERALVELGGDVQLRMGVRKAGPVVSDQGNLILDCRFAIDDPAQLETNINNIAGVVDNGIFAGIASAVLIGSVSGGEPVVRELVRTDQRKDQP